MKKILYLFVLFLISCSTQPQVTVTSEVTVTLPPPVPTPTLHPKFVELQETIAASGERFTLNPDGTIQDGATTTPNLQISPDGTMTLTVNSESITLDPADVNFDDKKGITIKGYELDVETGAWVEAVEPVKEFPWCNDFTKFDQFPVAFKDLQEQGRFVQSTLTEDLFDPAKIKFEPMKPMSELNTADGTFLAPNIKTAPNYEDPATVPFAKEMMCGVTVINGEQYLTIQVPYYIGGRDPKDWPVMTGVRKIPGGGYNQVMVDYFTNRMNVVPWQIDEESIAIATQFTNPRTGKNFTTAEVKNIISMMSVGNFALADGLVLKFMIADAKDGQYR